MDANTTLETIIALRKGGHTWKKIGVALGLSREAVRKRYQRYKATQEDRMNAPDATIEGLMAEGQLPDEEEVLKRALEQWQNTQAVEEKRKSQTIAFPYGPIALTFFGDRHLGGAGVNVPRVFEEAELVAKTPGMWAVDLGDPIDNFIVGKLMAVRLHTQLTIPDEFALVRRLFRLHGKKMVAALGGNHVFWTQLLTGIDYFREVLAGVCPRCLYDADEIYVNVKVGEAEFPGLMRHKWRGTSIYNVTHGQERANKWPSLPFVWAAGAHFHRGGAARSFTTTDGEEGLAVQCGSYKEVDPYTRRMGFARHNNTAAVAIVFDEQTRSMTGFTDIRFCAQFMKTLYRASQE
jgi:hypothetical protein